MKRRLALLTSAAAAAVTVLAVWATLAGPPSGRSQGTESPSLSDLLKSAREVRYSATFKASFPVPVLPETPPSTPSAERPPFVDVSAMTHWYISPPNRRFEARYDSEAARLIARLPVAPGAVSDQEGLTPTMYFRGNEAFMCQQLTGQLQCEGPAPKDWGQWAMAIVGQTPLVLFPFVADLDQGQVREIWRDPVLKGARVIAGETAYCFSTVLSFGPPGQQGPTPTLEVCYSTLGVPLSMAMRGDPIPASGMWLEAASYTLDVADGVFDLPTAPTPWQRPAPPPGGQPRPPEGPRAP